jgi:hypothetical protein
VINAMRWYLNEYVQEVWDIQKDQSPRFRLRLTTRFPMCFPSSSDSGLLSPLTAGFEVLDPLYEGKALSVPSMNIVSPQVVPMASGSISGSQMLVEQRVLQWLKKLPQCLHVLERFNYCEMLT